MRVLELTGNDGELRLSKWPDPHPGPADVIVDITHCAIATGELLVRSGQRQSYNGTETTFAYPHIMGFQGVGTIVEVGDQVDTGRLGSRVTINGVVSCGVCDECRRGQENWCATKALLGLDSGHHGCLAERVKVPAINAHDWPANLPSEWAPHASELATMVHALKRIGVRPGEELAIIGAGQTGIMAVPAARTLGADLVISIDIDHERLQLARQLGADHTVDASTSDPVEAVRELTQGGASRVLEVVGYEETVLQAVRMAAVAGVVGLVGVSGRIELSVPDYEASVVAKEIELLGCLGKTNGDYASAVRLLERNLVDVSLLPIQSFRFEAFEEAWGAAQESNGERILLEIGASSGEPPGPTVSRSDER